jgi:hypothetical protein
MAQKKVFWLVSTKAKGLKFKIVSLDRDNMRATLQGDTGVPFETSVSQDVLDKLGYVVETTMEEVPDAPVLSDQPT